MLFTCIYFFVARNAGGPVTAIKSYFRVCGSRKKYFYILIYPPQL